MQPLAYFAVRGLLGWLQWMEQSERAVRRDALLLVATGAAHCWAVVYALFIAIHTRAMRYDGYHEGYTEHLPSWVSWTETLAVASMGVWWMAGFTTGAIRIIDDDARGLPMEGRDVDVNIFLRVMRSQTLHSGLAFAHTLSCVGLFASILLLCVAMALMKGAVTACELCLCVVSVGFALPHAVVAGRRLHLTERKRAEGGPASPEPAAEAAAQEAAALGPQLCVILALADSPGHAFLCQNLVYLLSAGSFVAAVAACGQSPAKVWDAAIPPETGEFFTCILLDVAASVALVVCFPHLNTWHLWALVALLVLLFVAVWYEGWRELVIDLLDPLMVVRSDTDKLLPGRQRQLLRRASWLTTLLCAGVALWDIMLHPVQEGLFEPPEHEASDEGLPDLWDPSSLLLLRWRPQGQAGQAGQAGEEASESRLLGLAAEALALEVGHLAVQRHFPEHRLLVFKYSGTAHTDKLPTHLHWKAVLQAPQGSLAAIVEPDFPGTLNVTLCLRAEMSKQKDSAAARADSDDSTTTTTAPAGYQADLARVVGESAEAQAAYLAGCGWWSESLDLFYNSAGNRSDPLAGSLGFDDEEENRDEEGPDIAELSLD